MKGKHRESSRGVRAGRPAQRLFFGSAYAWAEGCRSCRVGEVIYAWRMVRWRVAPQRLALVYNVWGTRDEVEKARQEVIEYMLTRKDMPPPNVLQGRFAQADAWGLEFPVLWNFMTQTKWEDGEPRVPGSLLIFEQDGVLKGMLRDKDRDCCLWVSAPGLHSLFEVLENSILSPGAEWRVDRKPGNPVAKRVKR